ncbi:hypothetical protein CU102_04785 [Phyllobacterium brassicacearum]|uniref:Uncharacterized protein n=1 Tax=Phyllobacterium brassicacearum TaxID=314235 RepID=A0A2P7BV95_9HYPH|nr:hypothetical protein [Phyllobacterium brassicacearum]PSH70388.1 hypothetical protein CU102_04785 [Phyllobacterium brassicacearum]
MLAGLVSRKPDWLSTPFQRRSAFPDETDRSASGRQISRTIIDARSFIEARAMDPETQAIVRRESLPSDWEHQLSEANQWIPWIWQLLASTDADTIIAVPLAKPKKQRDKYFNDLRELRSVGFADPY